MTNFKVTKSGTQLVNRALDLIAESPIPSLDDQVAGVVARTARQWYKPTVAWLLERHDWGLAQTRAPLVAEAVNTRSNNWLYAYRVPEDCAFVTAINPADTATGVAVGYYAGLRAMLMRQRFERVVDILYSSIPAAVIDYTSYTVDETSFPEEFCDIIVLMLASRFAVPIAKKAGLEEKYRNMAQGALDVALARSRNENEPTYGDTPTETELIRGSSMGIGWFDPSWPAL